MDVRYLGQDILRLAQDLENAPKTRTLNEGFDEVPDGILSIVRKLAIDQKAWPLLSEDLDTLSKLPPCFFQIAEFDPMRDEGLLFYNKLRSLNVSVSMSFVPKSTHAEPILRLFLNQPETVRSRFAISEVIQFIRQILP